MMLSKDAIVTSILARGRRRLNRSWKVLLRCELLLLQQLLDYEGALGLLQLLEWCKTTLAEYFQRVWPHTLLGCQD
jgi:hypothetical protein